MQNCETADIKQLIAFSQFIHVKTKIQIEQLI